MSFLGRPQQRNDTVGSVLRSNLSKSLNKVSFESTPMEVYAESFEYL